MPEIKLDEIGAFLKRRINSFESAPVYYRRGTVIRVGDGVVRVAELPGRKYAELLEFDSGAYGIVMDLSEDGVGAVLLNGFNTIHEGDSVRGTGRVAEVPVGEELLGRVIDSIGRPIDGLPLEAKQFLPAERPAPGIMERRPVDTPLETGILAIDSMIPIGRGQRELIIGDRQTGKTTIAIDTILNQKNKDVICVYCAVGQKASNIVRVIETLRENRALDYSVVVATTASDSPAMQYLAPYAACSVAEGFMREGKDVLIVYDDLSKHAVAYRTMSLLLHRPPGREAYPGDVFYLHSRLLERSACMSQKNGGGSITALPIIETMGGNISAYIPTNVISITDGQIYLESELFHSGIRPAVNTGLSVSRVGRAAQHSAIRSVSGTLRIELSQYREMAVFTRFGSDVDEATARMLSRGENLTMLLKQPKASPYSVFEETALLLAYREKLYDGIPADAIIIYSKQMLEYLHEQCTMAEEKISDGELDSESEERLIEAIKNFREHYYEQHK